MDDNFNEHEAELLDEEEIQGCGCTDETEPEHDHATTQSAWED